VFGLKGMYAMEKLPVYSLNKKKGNLAADYLKRVISNFAVVNIIDESRTFLNDSAACFNISSRCATNKTLS
jgi:hypothetical protein